MGIKQLYNDNLRKLPNKYGDISVMSRFPSPRGASRCKHRCGSSTAPTPIWGEILLEPKWHFIAQSLSYSPFHRLEMTEILLKGRKTLTHPSYPNQTFRYEQGRATLLEVGKKFQKISGSFLSSKEATVSHSFQSLLFPHYPSVESPWTQWTPWKLSTDSVDIYHGLGGQSGQYPWILWTKSSESMDKVHWDQPDCTMSIDSVDIVHGLSGHCPWTQWTAWTLSMDTLDWLDIVHGLTGQSPVWFG